jgi:hypothetical protein
VRTSFFYVTAAAGAVAAFFSLGLSSARLAVAATPPPTPPPIGAPAYPSPAPNATVLPAPAATASSSPAPRVRTKPTPSPPPNARKGLDGVWEVAIQHPNTTDYTHFKITQQGDAITGTYLDSKGKRYPLAGSIDGQAIRLIVSMPNGTTMLLEGKLDGTTDMVGMLTMPTGQVPFTASYRAKQKWIENVNPSPGGISQPGSYTPP